MSVDPLRFQTTMASTGKNTTGIVVPPDIIAALNAGARPAVSVKVNEYVYRTTVGIMGGRSMLPFSAENRAMSGISGGDEIVVEIALDTASREVEVPTDLSAALVAAGASEAFAKLAPSRRKADIANVTSAKTAETRDRRISAIVTRLAG